MGRVLRATRGLVIALIVCLSVVAVSHAQESRQLGQLFVTDANADSFPSVQLRLYGIDGQGNPIDFAATPLFITHDGFPVDEIVFDGRVPVGTLTVFLIDAPPGVADQLPAIQDLMRQYAAAGNMQEQLDYVAVYQIGAEGPRQLLSPTPFHNGVNNLFITEPLQAEAGATELYDSALTLVEEVPGLKPNPDMAASIVLLSDGTDPGTSTATPGQVPLSAAAAGIPIHTIRLSNPDLNATGQELGRAYLADVATGSRGVAADLADPASIAAVWERIAAFREQSLVRYTVPEPAAGTFPVEVSLADNRDLRASTEVTIAAAVPSVTIDLPRESRTITVPDLERPVELQLSTTVSWLDGQTRDITAAALLVNGAKVADIPVDQLASFRLPVGNLFFGDNRMEVSVTDSQGFQSTSPAVILTVNQGDRVEVPEALQPAGSGFPFVGLLLALALIGLIIFGVWLWRSRQTSGAGRSRRRRRTAPAPEPYAGTPMTAEAVGDPGVADYPAAPPSGQSFVLAHLEVLESQTYMPDELSLGDIEVRLGRSPAQSTIAFRDDITVSRYHAVLRLEGSRYRIYDAGSTSGTYVNDRRVPDYGLQLTDGDEIGMGAVRLRYRQL